MPTATLIESSEAALFDGFAAEMRAPELRSLGRFAEDEIVLPDGPFQGRPFRLDRHPAARLLFAEIDSGRWHRVFWTGPNQDGKTLLLQIVLCYLLFERQETVVYGVPTAGMVLDKWRVDLLPVIRASRYRDLLPERGAGSRGGEADAIEFKNGVFLRFMTAGGDDQSRAGFTTKNLVVTETDGFDEVGGSSREGDKFTQLLKRTFAFVDEARVVSECTVSTEQGRIWQEYQRGTRSRIALPCPHCGGWVTPEREHLHGWQDAETEDAAAANARIHCPACGAAWSDEERVAANRRAVLAHRGQEVGPDGVAYGEPPATKTLGFRWTAVNAVLKPGRLAQVAREEWAAKRSTDEEVAERNLCQSQWALPAKPASEDLSKLDATVIAGRTLPLNQRECPPGTLALTVAIDVGQYRCYWTAIAWTAGATPHVLDYGVAEVHGQEAGVDQAILSALMEWRDTVVKQGWQQGGTVRHANFAFVDSGNWTSTIHHFCLKSGPKFLPTKGYGVSQRVAGSDKRETGSKVAGVGDRYALVTLATGGRHLEVDADHWKSWLHDRAGTPLDQPGALTLFAGKDHFSFAKHLTAEKRVEEFSPVVGRVVRWRAVNRNNHWLDATTLACVAGHLAGMKLTTTNAPAAPAPPPRPAEREGGWVDRGSNWLNR